MIPPVRTTTRAREAERHSRALRHLPRLARLRAAGGEDERGVGSAVVDDVERLTRTLPGRCQPVVPAAAGREPPGLPREVAGGSEDRPVVVLAVVDYVERQLVAPPGGRQPVVPAPERRE